VLLVSFLLVIVATIFLLSGLFLTGDLPLIFISIGCSALAGLVLVAAVLRSRPRAATVPAYEGPLSAPLAAGAEGLEVVESAPGRATGGARFADRPFPIPDYDSLEVVEVLPLLAELEPEDLEMVRQQEASGRAHPWILARIDALLESEVAEAGWSKPEGEWAAADFPLESRSELDELSLEADGIEVVQEFPIADYDDLKVSEILPLLPKLDPIELRMVRQEEAAGRARSSIISRIDSLLSGGTAGAASRAGKTTTSTKRPSRAVLPIENYDELTVPQITARLGQLNEAELKALRTYERRHKARAGVLAKIESALRR
jgi:hypothetical protein